MYLVSSSPHAHSGATVQRIMLDVLIALVPAFVAAAVFYGFDAVRLVLACVITCVACEWLCRKAMGREQTVSDLSAVLTAGWFSGRHRPGKTRGLFRHSQGPFFQTCFSRTL